MTTGAAAPPGYDPLTQERSDGFRDLVGYRVAEWSEGRAAMSLEVRPEHANRGGGLHGGAIASLIDSAGGFCGCWCPVPGRVRRAVTVSLTVSFVAPPRGPTVRAVGVLRSAGRRLFVAQIDAYDADGALIATGLGTYRYGRGSEKLEGVPLDQSTGPAS